MTRTTGVVLAGGRSTRFGSDKLAADHRGAPLLHHAIGGLRTVCDDVVVVLAPGADAGGLPDGIRSVHDPSEGRGPLAGLAAGLEGLDRDGVALAVGGDMPDLQPAVLGQMLRVLGAAGARAVTLDGGDGARPLPCALQVGAAADAAHALLDAGRRRLRDLLGVLDAVVMDPGAWTALDPERRTLRDVDVPADLDASTGRRLTAMSHVPAFVSGDVEVRTVCEGWAPLDLADECPGRRVDWPAELARHPWSKADDRTWAWHVHAFVLSGPFGLALVDTGLGSFPPAAPWAERAVDPWAGVDADAVGIVAVTHLHADHAGGAVAGAHPRFPNARHVVHPADWSFFEHGDDRDDYTARHAMDALGDALDLDPADRELAPGIRLVHTPGHTPGHRSVLVGEDLLITGDLLHLPIQVRHPDWRSNHDEEPEVACRSRAELLARARAEGRTVAVNHFGLPFGAVGDDGWTSMS